MRAYRVQLGNIIATDNFIVAAINFKNAFKLAQKELEQMADNSGEWDIRKIEDVGEYR